MFTINIRLHDPKDHKIWKLVFGKHQFKKSLPCVDIGLYEGHCFYIKDIEMLTEHWECVGCQQRFIRHNNHTLHITENLFSGGKTKLICKGKKFKHMNSSEKVCYGGNTQLVTLVANGLKNSLKKYISTFTMLFVDMVVKGVSR